MVDLDNITQFSGITITSDQGIGTNNPNATFAFPSVTSKQRDGLKNVTPYVANGVTYQVKPGTMIYNITTGFLQLFGFTGGTGQWQNIGAVNTAATGIGLTNGGPFIYPSGPRAAVEVEDNEVSGFTYFDTTENVIRTYKNDWETITSAPDEE